LNWNSDIILLEILDCIAVVENNGGIKDKYFLAFDLGCGSFRVAISIFVCLKIGASAWVELDINPLIHMKAWTVLETVKQ